MHAFIIAVKVVLRSLLPWRVMMILGAMVAILCLWQGVASSVLASAKSKEKKAPTLVQPAGPQKATPVQSLSLEQVRVLQSQLKDTTALSVDFSQSVYKSLRKRTSVSLGQAYFAKPNYFRWVLKTPNTDQWLFDGQELIHYQPSRQQATRYGAAAAKGQELRQIVNMVLNFDALLSQYKLLKAQQKAQILTLSLEPLKANDIVAAELTLDLEKNYISVVRLEFRGNNHTTFTFTNPQRKPLTPKFFEVPAGVKTSSAL